MYDPFIDSLNDPEPLQAPLAPSRSATPSTAQPPSDAQIDHASSNDLAALFDPLASLPTSSRISQTPASSKSMLATSKAAYDPSAQPKQRPTMLPVSTQADSLPSPGDPLQSLLGSRSNDDVRAKASRPFTTTPLFQAPSILHRPPPPTFPRPAPHSRAISDDFGSFVSVPPTLDPLSFVASPNSLAPSTESRQQSTVPTTPNDFTKGARQRHAENAERILGEFARSEEPGGDFLGWLEDAEHDTSLDAAAREKILQGEEGPNSPPATPTDGPPPSTRTPKQKIGSPARRDDSGSRERKEASPSGGVGSYFPPSLPRRFTTLLSSVAPAAAQMSPSTHRHGAGDEGEEAEDPHGIMAMPVSSSVARLSSIPHTLGPQPHPPMTIGEVTSEPQLGLTKAATFPPPIASTSSRMPKTIPDAFLTHHTPFASVKYIPPTGAPGFAGEDGWDTGGFAADWDGEGAVETGGAVKKATEMMRSVPRLMRLIGRKEETAGVLTRGLGDAVRNIQASNLKSTHSLLV